MKSTLRALGLATALASTVVVSGCGQTTAGTAAVVDGQRISEEDVRLAAEQINTQFQPQTPLTARSALMYLVVGPAARAAADKAGIPDSSDGALKSRFPAVPDVSPTALDVLRANVDLSTLSQTNPEAIPAIAQEALAMKPSINPRYGTFDAEAFDMKAASPAWISTGS